MFSLFFLSFSDFCYALVVKADNTPNLSLTSFFSLDNNKNNNKRKSLLLRENQFFSSPEKKFYFNNTHGRLYASFVNNVFVYTYWMVGLASTED